MYTVQCEKNYTYRRSTGWAPWDHTLVAIGLILSSLNRFSIFFTGFLGKFAVKSLLKIAPPCLHMLPHYLWNINVWKQAINDKLQNSVATYLRCVGVVNNQIKKGLLLSLSVKKNKIGEYLAKLQARTWLFRALSSSFSSMLARRTNYTREPRSCL